MHKITANSLAFYALQWVNYFICFEVGGMTARHLPPRHLPPATLAPRRHLPPGTYLRNPLFDFKDFLHGLSLGTYLKDRQKIL